MLSKFLTVLTCLPFVALASPHGSKAHNHHAEIARRSSSDLQLHRRDGARWTFYDVGLGACGKVNVASDFIVALNAAEFGSGYPGPHCFEWITMTFNGKTTSAQITDRCPGCPPGGLDLSRGLFNFFASEGAGVITGSWSYGGGGGGSPAPPPPPPPPKVVISVAPKPTPPPEPKPAPTPTPPPPPPPSPTPEKAQDTSTSTTATSTSTNTTLTTSTTSTSSTPTSTPAEILKGLNDLNQAFLGLAISLIKATTTH